MLAAGTRAAASGVAALGAEAATKEIHKAAALTGRQLKFYDSDRMNIYSYIQRYEDDEKFIGSDF